MPFVKGQSGNPGGARKKDDEVTKLAKKEAPEAFKRIIEIAKKGIDEKTRLIANSTIIDRAWGKAKQQAEVTGEGGGPIKFAVIQDPDE